MSEGKKSEYNLQSVDPLRVEATKSFAAGLGETIKQIDYSNRLHNMGAPKMIQDRERGKIEGSFERLGVMGAILGLSEEQIRHRAIELLSQKLPNPKDNPAVQFSGSDHTIIALRSQIEAGERTFITEDTPSQVESVRESLKAAIKEREDLIKRPNQFYLNGKWFDLGTEVDLAREEDSYKVSVEVPIIAGRSLALQTSKWDPKQFPEFDPEFTHDEEDKEITYPLYNALFYYQPNIQQNHRLIDPITEAEERSVEEGFSGNLGSVKPLESVAQLRADGNNIKPETISFLRQFVQHTARIDLEAIDSLTSVEIVKHLCKVIRAYNPQDSNIEFAGARNLDELVDEYKETGVFPGDCKSLATIAVGMVEAIGLKARTVGGAVFMEGTGDMEPHQWAEVFIPEVGKWGLMDPSFNKAISYPSRRSIYFIESYVAPVDPSLKLTISAKST